VAAALEVDPGNICLIGCHVGDTIGAVAAGCQAALILREGNAPLDVGPQPDYIGKDLDVIADQLNAKELAKTTLLALPLAEASVKIRTGPPDDGDSPDATLPIWAGVLPLAAAWQAPEPDPVLPADIPVPPHIAALVGRPADAPRS
jgi:hypothetical protein